MNESDWQRVKFASDCRDCECCGEPYCDDCGCHYESCSCLGPTEDGVEYEIRNGILYGRRLDEQA